MRAKSRPPVIAGLNGTFVMRLLTDMVVVVFYIEMESWIIVSRHNSRCQQCPPRRFDQ